MVYLQKNAGDARNAFKNTNSTKSDQEDNVSTRTKWLKRRWFYRLLEEEDSTSYFSGTQIGSLKICMTTSAPNVDN